MSPKGVKDSSEKIGRSLSKKSTSLIALTLVGSLVIMKMSRLNKPVIVLGAGGHARVLIDALHLTHRRILGALTPDSCLWGQRIGGVPILGGDEHLEQYSPDQIELVNGLGSVGDLGQHIRIYERFKQQGFHFASVIHPSVIMAADVNIGEGVQLMARCVIQTGCSILENSILNTSVSIDHDCHIGSHCHLAPGVILSGNISIGDRTHIGTAAVIIQNLSIGSDCLVAAGSVVIRDIEDGGKVKGLPAAGY